ncbi:MAG: dTMP kinase [Sphingomonadaceae bacterium]|nr:dTMP kinase [Sphingomonadaceae bacterium]
MTQGRFITLEGGEGAGKSTQLHLLAEALRAQGKTVITTREPGGTEGAEAIRGLLLTGGQDRWNDATEALLFAAARADHVAKLIRPALARGDWVVCDRFIDSTRAYQGGAGGLSDADILALHRVGAGGLLPDRTLLLDLSVEEGARRAEARSATADRMGAKDRGYYLRVADRFRAIAAEEPARFRVIDAAGSPSDVSTRIMSALGDLL